MTMLLPLPTLLVAATGPSGWIPATLVLGGALIAGLVECLVVLSVLRLLTRRWGGVLASSLVARAARPMLWLTPALNVLVALPATTLDEQTLASLVQGVWIVVILLATWLLSRLTLVATDTVAAKYPLDVPDNRQARRITTLTQILRRVAMVVIVVIGVSAAIMTFPEARSFGASVLASAGIAALVIGMAARPALSNVIAGVQIALSEPIALDDVVIVEGEWGRIEEITMTYVVVRVWDLRRLIVPLSHFIERPFQNWTRQTADLLGTVHVHTDFGVRVDSVREALTLALESSGMWDRRVNVVHVTDAIEGRLELRLLMSAANAPLLWDLRCHVREKIVEFLQREHPRTLMRTRVELVAAGDNGGPPAREPQHLGA
jgi:small-conductance mechanosensitive channel